MDKRIFFLLLFTAAAGLATGVFFEVFMTGSTKDHLMNLLSAYLRSGGDQPVPQIFLQNMIQELPWLLLSFSAAFLPLLLPVAAFFLLTKGLFLGFSAAMALEALGFQGILPVFVTLLFSGMVQVILFAGLLTLSAAEASHRLCNRKKRTAPQPPAKQYLSAYLFGLAVLTLSVLLHAVLLQAVL